MLMNGRQSSLLYAKLRSPAFYFPNVFEVGQHIGTEIHVVGLLFDAGGYLLQRRFVVEVFEGIILRMLQV